MSSRTWFVSLSLAAALSAGPSVAHAEKITIDEDTFFNLGVLAQPQLTFGENLSPNEGWNSDFFIRRARFVLAGQIDPHIGFIFITDQPNWGKGNDFTPQFIVQDAVASYKFGPELTIDAGFMLLPFVRNNYLSAGGLNTVDFRTPTIKFPISRAFRDMGVEVRGLLANDLVYYRAGVFNGIAGRPGVTGVPPAPDVPELNGDDSPRFTGTARFNIAGKEDAYAFSGIYFAKEPMISVGAGVDFQPQVYGPDNHHLGVNADVFLDYPIDEDNEIVASVAVLHYADQGTISPTAVTHEAATAVYVEAGYRFQMIEPVLIYELFSPENSPQQSTLRGGINFWITQHRYNVKAEIAIPMNEDPPGGEAANDLSATLQTQVVF